MSATPYGAELGALAEKHYGADANRKPPSYLAEYQRFLAPRRNDTLCLLELGVGLGHSMLMWQDYLPRATVVGIDTSRRPERFPADKRFHFIRGSQGDNSVLAQAVRAGGRPFDLIIDDCSHVGRLAAQSFAYLFPSALTPGGLYVIEDICTAFLPRQFPDAEPYDPPPLGPAGDTRIFPSHQNGMVGLVKQIFDHVMSPTAGGKTPYPIAELRISTNVAFIRKA